MRRKITSPRHTRWFSISPFGTAVWFLQAFTAQFTAGMSCSDPQYQRPLTSRWLKGQLAVKGHPADNLSKLSRCPSVQMGWLSWYNWGHVCIYGARTPTKVHVDRWLFWENTNRINMIKHRKEIYTKLPTSANTDPYTGYRTVWYISGINFLCQEEGLIYRTMNK